MKGTAIERFEAKYIPVTESGCWLWIGSSARLGYGQLYVNGRLTPAHRFSYEHYIGPIPTGLELDHLCRVPACVNPKHLEPVTHRENMLRGDNPFAAKHKQTHCKRGHELARPNLVNTKNGRRMCRACFLMKHYQYRKEKRARVA